jgi:hypothetical protein
MHEDDAIGAFIGKRKFGLLDQHAHAVARVRPRHRAKFGGHQRAQATGVVLESAEIGGGETETEQALAVEIAPARAQPRAEQPAHNSAERRGVELFEVDGVEMHHRRLRVIVPLGPQAYTLL